MWTTIPEKYVQASKAGPIEQERREEVIDEKLEEMGFGRFEPSGEPIVGQCFRIDNRNFEGTYWLYRRNGFSLDIQDFHIKEDYVSTITNPDSANPFYISTYFKRANGECLSPYISMANNSLLAYVSDGREPLRSILHGGYPYLAVSLKFDLDGLAKLESRSLPLDALKFEKFFLEYNDSTVRSIEIIAEQILKLDKSLPGADLILEGKMMEWLGICLSSHGANAKTKSLLGQRDNEAIDRALSYIDNHYMLEIRQDLLEKITLLSGTKLKRCFKLKTGLTITEYVQRKRIDMAELLLARTDLSIKNVAESVGYSSHSRFTKLYARYKGVAPVKARK